MSSMIVNKINGLLKDAIKTRVGNHVAADLTNSGIELEVTPGGGYEITMFFNKSMVPIIKISELIPPVQRMMFSMFDIDGLCEKYIKRFIQHECARHKVEFCNAVFYISVDHHDNLSLSFHDDLYPRVVDKYTFDDVFSIGKNL